MLLRYWSTVLPVSRRELRRWQRRAASIPDPVLRAQACATLEEERCLCEGAALFATLVQRRRRARVVRLLVTLEVICDYLDTLSEQPAADPLANGRRLHAALLAAVGGAPVADDYYADHPRQDDGGYLVALVTACRASFADLPAAAAVAAVAAAAATRCGEGQSRNHAGMLDAGAEAPFADWCRRQAPGSGLAWWELAAAACSSLTLHAVVAAAADPSTTAHDAARIEAAYFPWISALSSLLDSLADCDADRLTGNHSYVEHYGSTAEAAARLTAIASCAVAAARELPQGSRHATIVAAMTCFYLDGLPSGSPARAAVLARLDVGTGLLAAMVRLRRLID